MDKLTGNKLIDSLGGNSAVATSLDCAPNVVANWRDRGIPWPRRAAIAKLADDNDVRLPDDFWGVAA